MTPGFEVCADTAGATARPVPAAAAGEKPVVSEERARPAPGERRAGAATDRERGFVGSSASVGAHDGRWRSFYAFDLTKAPGHCCQGRHPPRTGAEVDPAMH